MLEFNGDGLIATDITHDTVSIEGASNSMDPPFSFDTMSKFVTRFDDISDGNNDMSISEYLLVSTFSFNCTTSTHSTYMQC